MSIIGYLEVTLAEHITTQNIDRPHTIMTKIHSVNNQKRIRMKVAKNKVRRKSKMSKKGTYNKIKDIMKKIVLESNLARLQRLKWNERK